jgi:hypothetical protein
MKMMNSVDDILNLCLTREEILDVIKKVQDNLHVSALDNVRIRHENIQFDCMLRGYIGEFAITKWFAENGIKINNKNYLSDNESIDIDFIYKNINIELKTSLLPDADLNIANCFEKRDIKIIKRENDITNVRGDVHMQMIFLQKRKAKDEWLKNQKIIFTNTDPEYYFDGFKAKCFLKNNFFVGWMDKDTLIKRIKLLPHNNRTWTFINARKDFWNCRIRESNKPLDLIKYLNNL